MNEEKKVTEEEVKKESFLKKHWKWFAAGGALVLTAAGIVIFKKAHSRNKGFSLSEITNLRPGILNETEKYIDEDICTDLVPELEGMIVNRVEEGWISRNYDLGDTKMDVEVIVRKALENVED